MTIVILFGSLIALENGYLILTKMKSHFIVLLSIEYWENVLIYTLVLHASILFVEAGVLGWRKSSIRRLIYPSKSTQSDIIFVLLGIFKIKGLLNIVLSFGFLSLIYKSIPVFPSINIFHYINNPFLEGVVWFVVYDFISYFSHFLRHRIKFLWESHKFHHSATEFNVLTDVRSHAIDNVFATTSRLIILTIFGLPIQAIPYLLIFHYSISIINHSNLPWQYGWIGRWLIYSPYAHRIHHSLDPAHFDKNFGSILPIWDRIFGTWIDETKEAELIEIGLPENEFNKHNFIFDYWLCTLNTMKAFGRMIYIQKLRNSQSST